jgi:cytochrome P450
MGTARARVAGSPRSLATVTSARPTVPEDVDLTDLDRFAGGFPHDVFTRLRTDAPIAWHEPTAHTPDGEGFWVITRHADVTAIANDASRFVSGVCPARPGGGGTILDDLPAGFAAGVLLNMTDAPRHQQLRRLVTPTVSPRALAVLEGDLRVRAERIVDDALARGTCDLLVDLAAELPLQAIASLLGVPQSDRHDLLGWANATLDHVERDADARAARQQAAASAMSEYATRRIAEARRAPGEDMLSAFVVGIPDPAHPEDPTTDLEQQMFFSLLVAAGSETTRNSIAVGLLELAARPEQWELVRDHPATRTAAVEEMLRWASSTSYNRRTASTDVEVGGVTIGAGEKVTLWWSSANRDAEEFVDPFAFDVRRAPNRHVAFGHGPHFCLGAGLARLEMRLVLDVVLERIDAIEAIGPVEWVRSNKHTGVRHAPVVLHPR